jgi:hypothetical protein
MVEPGEWGAKGFWIATFCNELNGSHYTDLTVENPWLTVMRKRGAWYVSWAVAIDEDDYVELLTARKDDWIASQPKA